MSTAGEVLRHPVNGTSEQTWDGFSWPGFFFGVFWLLVKGLYGHFLINVILMIVSAGFAAPVIWVVYGFIGNGAHKSSLLKKGYMTEKQWAKKEQIQNRVPETTIPVQKDQVSQLRELAELRDKGVLTDDEFSRQKLKILNA